MQWSFIFFTVPHYFKLSILEFHLVFLFKYIHICSPRATRSEMDPRSLNSTQQYTTRETEVQKSENTVSEPLIC